MVENTKGSKGHAVKSKESYHPSSATQLHSSAGENKTKQKNTTTKRKKNKTQQKKEKDLKQLSKSGVSFQIQSMQILVVFSSVEKIKQNNGFHKLFYASHFSLNISLTILYQYI